MTLTTNPQTKTDRNMTLTLMRILNTHPKTKTKTVKKFTGRTEAHKFHSFLPSFHTYYDKVDLSRLV